MTVSTPRSRVPPPGIYVPTVTFFTPDDTLDVGATAHHALRMAKGGMAGLVVQGTNGEAVHLDAQGESGRVQLEF
jgi:2-keto-3-deoxy-L-rhamnonate aldolase